MNPALPVLLLLSLAPLAVRRRGWASGSGHSRGQPWRRAWAVSGIAAMVLLAPALALPDGVPSPAASLGTLPPWQEMGQEMGQEASQTAGPALDPTAGNPHLRDVTHQVEPWLIFMRAELREGRLPYWNPFQFSGTPFWSNGSSAPLFPLHLVFAALPLQLGLVLLPWLRLLIGGLGAWAFARQLGASERGALVAAVAFPLSGVVTSWLLYPMANCHALVPWVFWATERLARRPAAWPWLAAFGGLELLGGHPETAVFTGMLTAVYLVVRWPARRLATAVAFGGAWIVALLLAAVELVPLAATVLRSSKWLVELPYTAPSLALVGKLLLRLVMPEVFGSAAPNPLAPVTAEALAAGRAGTWWGPFNDPATAIYAGTATLLLAAAGVAAAWSGWRHARAGGDDAAARAAVQTERIDRERCWLAVAAMTLFALLAAYQAPGVRHVLLALPVIDKSLTHYLKLGLDLGLAILAARGVDAWLAGSTSGGRRALLAAATAVLALVGLCWVLFRDDWASAGLLPTEAAWTAIVVAVALALAASLWLSAPRRRLLWPLLLAVLIADLAFAHAWTNPGLSAAALYPETGAVRFLRHRAGALERIAGTGAVLHPNAAMVYRLYDVRGDTPVKLHDYQKAYASFAAPDPVFYQPIRRWASPWLDRLGVRWVVTPPGAPSPEIEAPEDGGVPPWRLAYDGKDARVWRRPGRMPVVRWQDPRAGRRAERSLDVLERSPGHWAVRWTTPEPATVVIAETWDPGWHARVDDRPVPIEAVRGVLLGVDVGGDAPSGYLELVYRPDGLRLGAGLSLLGLAALGAGAWRATRRTARRGHRPARSASTVGGV